MLLLYARVCKAAGGDDPGLGLAWALRMECVVGFPKAASNAANEPAFLSSLELLLSSVTLHSTSGNIHCALCPNEANFLQLPTFDHSLCKEEKIRLMMQIDVTVFSLFLCFAIFFPSLHTSPESISFFLSYKKQ